MEPKLSKLWSKPVSNLMTASLWIVKWCLLLSLPVYFSHDIPFTASPVWVGCHTRGPTPRGVPNHSCSNHHCTHSKRKTGANRTLPHGGYGRCYGTWDRLRFEGRKQVINVPFRRSPTSYQNYWNECVAPLLAKHLSHRNSHHFLHCLVPIMESNGLVGRNFVAAICSRVIVSSHRHFAFPSFRSHYNAVSSKPHDMHVFGPSMELSMRSLNVNILLYDHASGLFVQGNALDLVTLNTSINEKRGVWAWGTSAPYFVWTRNVLLRGQIICYTREVEADARSELLLG